jgi:hypothetical protein
MTGSIIDPYTLSTENFGAHAILVVGQAEGSKTRIEPPLVAKAILSPTNPGLNGPVEVV